MASTAIAAAITTETFRRADRADVVAAECVAAGRLRIRFDGGEWTIAGDPGTLAAFDSPEEAGLARYLLQAQGLTTYCAIPDGGFSYWTKADGSLPRGAVVGEYCAALGAISVRRQGRMWQVQSGRSVLYQSEDRAVADAIAATLLDTRAAAQCYVAVPRSQGRGEQVAAARTLKVEPSKVRSNSASPPGAGRSLSQVPSRSAEAAKAAGASSRAAESVAQNRWVFMRVSCAANNARARARVVGAAARGSSGQRCLG